MNYLVVGQQRTGSSLLHHYVVNKNDNFGFNEIFLQTPPTGANDVWYYNLSIEEKFELLEYLKKKEIYAPWKCFPAEIIVDEFGYNPQYEQRLINLLAGYKILTVDRDPWDVFLSHSYQDSIEWKTAHRFNNKNFIELDSFEIDLNKIPFICMKLKTSQRFINSLDIYHTFRYNDLSINNMKVYFQTDWNGLTKPNQIDYESIATNLKEAKELFDYEMYGT